MFLCFEKQKAAIPAADIVLSRKQLPLPGASLQVGLVSC